MNNQNKNTNKKITKKERVQKNIVLYLPWADVILLASNCEKRNIDFDIGGVSESKITVYNVNQTKRQFLLDYYQPSFNKPINEVIDGIISPKNFFKVLNPHGLDMKFIYKQTEYCLVDCIDLIKAGLSGELIYKLSSKYRRYSPQDYIKFKMDGGLSALELERLSDKNEYTVEECIDLIKAGFCGTEIYMLSLQDTYTAEECINIKREAGLDGWDIEFLAREEDKCNLEVYVKMGEKNVLGSWNIMSLANKDKFDIAYCSDFKKQIGKYLESIFESCELRETTSESRKNKYE